MTQVLGFDLSQAADLRERVTIGVAENRTVELPLIKLKDAYLAEIFCNRIDALMAEWATVSASFEGRILEYQRLKREADEAAEKNKDETIDPDEFYEGLQVINEAVQNSQKRQTELIRKVREVTEEIQDFLKPYLKDTEVWDLLQECDDAATHRVLGAMLHGMDAFKEPEDAESGEDDVKKT